MYKHIAKDGNIVKLTSQAKNAIDYTITKNNNIRKKIKIDRNDKILAITDEKLYEIQ
jgi:hypothetical protein